MRSVRDCKVAVVGGAGFLGSHLVDHLVEDRGCDVLVLDNLCAGRRDFVHAKASFEHCDIAGSEEHLRAVLRGCRFVMNYAALPYVPDSFAHPKRAFAVNCMGAINVINAAQEAGAEGILQVSSAEVYGGRINQEGYAEGNVDQGKLDERAPVYPHSSYGASKAAVDAYCQVAWRERKTPVIALRQFNCVGERETHPYVIPEIIGQLALQVLWNDDGISAPGDEDVPAKGIVKLGNNSSRDFIYAGDAVRIAVELLERGAWGEVYNSGSEDSIKVYDLAERVGKLMGFAQVKVERDEARVRPWDIWHLRSDNKKLDDVIGLGPLGWRKKLLNPLDEGLRRTIRWYEEQGRRWPWEK